MPIKVAFWNINTGNTSSDDRKQRLKDWPLINRQRERARPTLGTTFDLKAFNDTVVRGGNVPLDVLAGNVDEYIRTGRT